jgi:hypothetical protein
LQCGSKDEPQHNDTKHVLVLQRADLDEHDDDEAIERNAEKVHDCRAALFGDVLATQCALAREIDTAADLEDEKRHEHHDRLGNEGGGGAERNDGDEKIADGDNFGLYLLGDERAKEAASRS